MDEEIIVTIREELLEDFYALAEMQIDVIWKLLDRFEDDRLQVHSSWKVMGRSDGGKKQHKQQNR